jgi:putative transposase
MARSTFYYHLKRSGSAVKYEKEKKRIQEIFQESKGCYGYRRITLQLRNDGYSINHKTVEKLMQKLGIKCQIRKKRYRSYKGTVGKIAPNILNRNFKADSPCCKLATDVSQISIGQQKSFLSPVIDMFNGEILSYNISDRADLEQINKMLNGVFAITDKVPAGNKILLHSDQGWQYQHKDYQNALAQHGIIQSMSRKGNCLDNSVIENFFGLMKSELLYNKEFKSMQEFKEELEQYIDWYNNKRIKIKLNGMSPVQYRAHYIENL